MREPDVSSPALVSPSESSAGHAGQRPNWRGRWRRRRRWIAYAATPIVTVLIFFAISYIRYMTEPTSMTFSQRSAEWVRDDVPFGNWMIDEAEHIYYTANAPQKGGPQLKQLPRVGLFNPLPFFRHVKRVHYEPPRIRPVFAHPLPGEGVWQRTGPKIDGAPPALVATYRPNPEYPQVIAYVLWVDHTRTDLAYYPGRYEPPDAVDRGPMMVPDDQRNRLLATFNGGFTHDDGDNGSAVNGHTNEPLDDGNATLIGYRNGRIAVVDWHGGPDAPADVAWARQSLAPILWNGKLNPGLNTDPNSPQWGFTLGGVTLVWRTAVGVDRHNNLIYVVADDQSVISIAQILQHVGAVRGMEFDINPDWHTLITYSHQHGLQPKMVEPQPEQPDTRYLVPDDRDFFAVYTRARGAMSVPFK